MRQNDIVAPVRGPAQRRDALENLMHENRKFGPPAELPPTRWHTAKY